MDDVLAVKIFNALGDFIQLHTQTLEHDSKNPPLDSHVRSDQCLCS